MIWAGKFNSVNFESVETFWDHLKHDNHDTLRQTEKIYLVEHTVFKSVSIDA